MAALAPATQLDNEFDFGNGVPFTEETDIQPTVKGKAQILVIVLAVIRKVFINTAAKYGGPSERKHSGLP